MKVYRSNKAKENILRTYDKLLGLWGVPVAEREVPTHYGPTHVIHWGKEQSPPLALFHGVGDDSALMWLYNAKALGEHFSVYAIDTIGGPGKSVPNENYNREFDDVRWLTEVFDGLELSRFYAAGVSNGAYLTQLCARSLPGRVLKAVSLAGAVPAGSSGSPMKTMTKIFLPEALFPTKKNVEKLLKKLAGENAGVFTQNPVVMEHYTWLLKGFNNMAMAFHKIERFTDEEIASIRDKVLYLIGEEDPFAKLGGKAALLQYHMNVRFYEKTGHGINHERAEEINAVLTDYFLKETVESI